MTFYLFFIYLTLVFSFFSIIYIYIEFNKKLNKEKEFRYPSVKLIKNNNGIIINGEIGFNSQSIFISNDKLEKINNELNEEIDNFNDINEETPLIKRSYGTYKYDIEIDNNDIIMIDHTPLVKKVRNDKHSNNLSMECIFKINNNKYIITIWGDNKYNLIHNK